MTMSTCKWLQKKKKLINPLPDVGQTRKYFTRLIALLLYFLHLLPICLIKETSIQTPIRWYSRTLVHYLLRRPAFRNKSLFLASIPHLQIIGLLFGEQTKLGLSNTAESALIFSAVEYTLNTHLKFMCYFFYALLFDKRTFVSHVFLLKAMLFQSCIYPSLDDQELPLEQIIKKQKKNYWLI